VFVLDTSVISHASPKRRADASTFVAWLERNGAACWLSAITVAELSYGSAWLAHRHATRQSAELDRWLEGLAGRYRDRIIPVDEAVARRGGLLLARARANGTEIGMEDALIAASADLHCMAVLTTNLKHFEPTGVRCLDPFATPLPG